MKKVLFNFSLQFISVLEFEYVTLNKQANNRHYLCKHKQLTFQTNICIVRLVHSLLSSHNGHIKSIMKTMILVPAVLSILASACNAASVPGLLTVTERAVHGSYRVCQQSDVLSCDQVTVDIDLLESRAAEIVFPDGHVLSRDVEIDVSDTAHGVSYSVTIH